MTNQRPGRLFENKNFWVVTSSDWALIKRIIKKQNVRQVKFSKISSKLDFKNHNFLRPYSDLPACKKFLPQDWVLIWTGRLIEHWSLNWSFRVSSYYTICTNKRILQKVLKCKW